MGIEKSDFLPKTGGWIMIRSIIPIDKPIIDPLSLWYAMPTGRLFVNGEHTYGGFARMDDYDLRVGMRILRLHDWEVFKKVGFNYLVYGKSGDFDKSALEDVFGSVKKSIDFEQQVQIKTLFGDVVIQPQEFTMVKRMDEYFESLREGHAFMRYMTKNESLSGKVTDQIFYLRSRGIGYSEALQMVWQNIKSQNQFYIEFHPEYQRQFTRGWDRYFFDKIKWMNKHGRVDLLNYGKQWSTEDFLVDYSKSQIENAA